MLRQLFPSGTLKHDAVARCGAGRDGGCARVAQGKVNVATSFTILVDFARNVGGDRVEVVSLVGPNGDAHSYVPSPADAKKLADAKLVILEWAWPRRVDRALHARRREEREGDRRQRRHHTTAARQ
jgi:ABC-type metal ion transport system, periplasmic component/surface adhesin